MEESELYIGLMSGTSMDGIDAGLFDLRDRCLTVATHSRPYPPELRERLWTAGRHPDGCTIDELASLDTWVGECFADAAGELIPAAGYRAIGAIGSHGQTLRHRPRSERPFTVQIGDPNIIAARCGITTVADFRRRDLAHGGEGAPLATAFHRQYLADAREARVVLNLGGIANVTVLPAGGGPVSGFDTGPGNTLLDAWIAVHRKLPCDRDGEWADSGRPAETLLARMREDPYFGEPPPKSTGFEHFNLAWLRAKLDAAGGERRFRPEDVQATLVALTAETVAGAVRTYAPGAARVLACGGGVRNGALMRALASALSGLPIESTAAFGVEPGWVEAATFAWLARQRLEGLPGNLPSVTGASAEAVLGGVYFGGARVRAPAKVRNS